MHRGTQTIDTHTHTHTHTHTQECTKPTCLMNSFPPLKNAFWLIFLSTPTPTHRSLSFILLLFHILSLYFSILNFFLRIFFYIESVQDLKISFSHMLNIKMWITRQNYLCNSNKCAKSIQWSSLIIKHATPLNEPIYTHFRQYDLLKTSEDR